MPELPEVETVVQSLTPLLTGHVIRSATFSSRHVTRGDLASAGRAIEGATVNRVERRGKHILLHLDRGFLHIHLGMTGAMLWNGIPGPHTRAVIQFDNGTLVYNDIRQFGRMNFYSSLPSSVAALGPEPLQISFEEFWARLHVRRAHIKPLLLNQGFMGGLGNIYVDESLFAAQLHPKARADRLSRSRASKLFEAIQTVLRRAIENRGSSISDYVDTNGAKGGFQHLHQVYGKAGSKCVRCGGVIRRTVIAQRGTHFCPKCQRI
jgi:formamidopyrimidine-DNA glycosylase